jgi:hypothetical protein
VNTPIRLVANGKFEIHPPMKKPSPVKPVEFDIPVEATSVGDLRLTFTGPRARAAAGTGTRSPKCG